MKLILFAFVVVALKCISAESPPEVFPACNMRCTRDYRPVCGVRYRLGRPESLTHSNECMYNLYNCENPRMPYRRLVEDGDCISKGYPPVRVVPLKQPSGGGTLIAG